MTANPVTIAPVTPSRRPAGPTSGRPASRPADAAASSTPTATGPALKVTVARKGRMRSSGAEKSTTTQKPTRRPGRMACAGRTRARRGPRGRTRGGPGPRCPRQRRQPQSQGDHDEERQSVQAEHEPGSGYGEQQSGQWRAQHRPQFPHRASQRVGLDEIIVSHHSGDAPADRRGQRRIDQGQDEDHREQSSQRRQQQRHEPGQDRLDQPADGEQAARAEPVRDHARQRRGQRRDRLREQQQPDRCRAARCSLHVQDQGSRRHRVAERADGLSRQQPGEPRRPPHQPEPSHHPTVAAPPVKRSASGGTQPAWHCEYRPRP